MSALLQPVLHRTITRHKAANTDVVDAPLARPILLQIINWATFPNASRPKAPLIAKMGDNEAAIFVLFPHHVIQTFQERHDRITSYKQGSLFTVTGTFTSLKPPNYKCQVLGLRISALQYKGGKDSMVHHGNPRLLQENLTDWYRAKDASEPTFNRQKLQDTTNMTLQHCQHVLAILEGLDKATVVYREKAIMPPSFDPDLVPRRESQNTAISPVSACPEEIISPSTSQSDPFLTPSHKAWKAQSQSDSILAPATPSQPNANANQSISSNKPSTSQDNENIDLPSQPPPPDSQTSAPPSSSSSAASAKTIKRSVQTSAGANNSQPKDPSSVKATLVSSSSKTATTDMRSIDQSTASPRLTMEQPPADIPMVKRRPIGKAPLPKPKRYSMDTSSPDRMELDKDESENTTSPKAQADNPTEESMVIHSGYTTEEEEPVIDEPYVSLSELPALIRRQHKRKREEAGSSSPKGLVAKRARYLAKLEAERAKEPSSTEEEPVESEESTEEEDEAIQEPIDKNVEEPVVIRSSGSPVKKIFMTNRETKTTTPQASTSKAPSPASSSPKSQSDKPASLLKDGTVRPTAIQPQASPSSSIAPRPIAPLPSAKPASLPQFTSLQSLLSRTKPRRISSLQELADSLASKRRVSESMPN